MEPEWNCLLLGGFVLLVFEVKSLYEARAVKLIKLLLTLLYISVSPLVMAGIEAGQTKIVSAYIYYRQLLNISLALGVLLVIYLYFIVQITLVLLPYLAMVGWMSHHLVYFVLHINTMTSGPPHQHQQH